MSVDLLQFTKGGLEKLGYYYYSVSQEDTKARRTKPASDWLYTTLTKHGLAKIANRVMITFEYDDDPRPIHEIPEIRMWYKQLDGEIDELPALVGSMPFLEFNGPQHYLLLLAPVRKTTLYDTDSFDAHIENAPHVLQQALNRIKLVSAAHHLSPAQTTALLTAFQSATALIPCNCPHHS